MKLASHNTLTYCKPKNWFMYLWRWAYKCQSRTLEKQYQKGARVFDIRIRFNRENQAVVAHGLVTFKVLLEDIWEWLNEKEDVKCRVMLETLHCMSDKELKRQKELFSEYCQALETDYPEIQFFGGESKVAFDEVYQFKNDYPYLLECYSSITGLGICPWLFSFLNRKDIEELKQQDDKDIYLMIDFI